MSTYQDYAANLAPIWLRGEQWQSEIRARAAPLDDLTLRARTAVLSRFLQFAPEDVLGLIGAERGLRRYPGEPAEVYRRRVQGAWEFWRLAGTVPGMTLMLAHAGYQASIVEHWRDPDPDRWAEFSISLTPLNPIYEPRQWGAGHVWGQQPGQSRKRWGGLNPNGVPLEYLRDLVQDIKPGHARLRRLTYRNRARYWGGTARWSEGREGAVPGVPSGWGVTFGVPFVRAPSGNNADNGPTWGGEPEIVLYDLYGT